MSKIKKILIMIPVLIGFGVIGLFVKHQVDYSKEFSSSEWKQLYSNFNVHLDNDELDAPDAYWDLAERKKMVKSLIKSKQLIGKTMEEVLEILGDEGEPLDKKNLHYWIGYSFGINQKYLDIIFNKNGKVVDVTTHES